MRPQIGQTINGKYRLEKLLGDGGMGSVYQARHEKLGITVALKFLHAELSRKGGLTERFMQEARASAQIRSPHVVRVTDVDQTPEGAAFIVLEHLEGRTLQNLYEDYHRTGTRLSYAEAIDYAMQMVDGLEAAHATGVVHRDLKPENVMITTGSKGEPVLKLLDFGIAKLKVAAGSTDKALTRPGVIMGTPEYMAPEQAYSADGVDSRADVFSLGVMLFEMLAGRRPVGGEDPRVIANAYLSGQTARLVDLVPTVAPDLAEAVQKAMAPLAKDRFPTATALREAIEPFADGARGGAPAKSSGRPPPPSAHVGSEPMMPPVDASAVQGTIIDGAPLPMGASPPSPEVAEAQAPMAREFIGAAASAVRGVAPTWPPGDDAPSEATKAMEPLLSSGAAPTSPGGHIGGAGDGGMTALMSGLAGGPAAAPPAVLPMRTPRKRKPGMSTAQIGLITAGVAGAAIILIALLRGGSSDARDPAPRPAPPPPPVASVPSEPSSAQANVQPPPPVAPPPVAPPPATPGPAQPRGPRPPSAPSSVPSSMPSGFPSGLPAMPPGLPSSIPGFPFPGQPPTPPAAPSAPVPPPATPQPPAIPTIPGLPPMPFPPPG